MTGGRLVLGRDLAGQAEQQINGSRPGAELLEVLKNAS
jgi:hypothetical protein